MTTTTKTTMKKRVALLEWCDPIMGCGYWLPELVDVAGGVSSCAFSGSCGCRCRCRCRCCCRCCCRCFEAV